MARDRLNPLEKRAVNRIIDSAGRPWNARPLFAVLLVVGLSIIGWGSFRVATGLGAWESAMSGGDFSWPAGFYAIVVGGFVVFAALGISGWSRERRVMASALRKLRDSR